MLRITLYKTMETYGVTCKKTHRKQKFECQKKNQNRLMLLPNCAICGKKKSKFIKNQEASELLSQLGIRILSRNISLFEKSSLK